MKNTAMIQKNEPGNKSNTNRDVDEQYMCIAIAQTQIAEDNGDGLLFLLS